ncbi:MAG: DUF5615 family PIN-like protein [Candidatus Brocadiae bacterium]|nr:DUF5615 family PIN-like protein [Candidatus Brocadiia bacterium]
MRLLLDQGLPRTAAARLIASGHDAVHVGDIGQASSTDSAILELARVQNRVVVTLDADFHAEMALSGATRPSVLRIRIEGLRADGLHELLDRVISLCESDIEAGALVSVEVQRVRLRRLPLARPPE